VVVVSAVSTGSGSVTLSSRLPSGDVKVRVPSAINSDSETVVTIFLVSTFLKENLFELEARNPVSFICFLTPSPRLPGLFIFDLF
jgi:hypothetical protein